MKYRDTLQKILNLDHRVKAGALQFAILISAIIAVLLSVFVVLVHSHSLFEKKSDLLIETIQQSEFTLLEALENYTREIDTMSRVLDAELGMTSKLHKSYWGMFGKVFSQATTKGKTFEKMAFVSGWQSGLDRTALFLQETNRPLIVVGNTKIEGKTYLPKRGVRAGTISGNSYYGNTLVYGTILKSSETLPQLPQQLTNYLAALQKLPLPMQNDRYIDLKPGRIYTNSFTKPVKTVFSRGELDLLNVKLVGNILIRSNTKIKVAASSTLKDVILIAPEIVIESNVKGTFQAIASTQILVGTNCELSYPSALVIKTEDDLKVTSNQELKKHIFIDQDTRVQGIICYLQDETKNRFEPQIMLKENSKLEGFLYCQQQLELLGNVYGSVYTSGFITKQFGSVYQNHIYNGSISSAELIDEYVGFPLGNLKCKVMKWLY
ncbi:hypothetical protein KORDIASMS9_01427 [Kordia sp. SMS9]|uniref:hypothetical protein n=1 Tax=Kordia sp. SMS9 TaxID=2282170 RepID=UPI000E0D051F|nr:hypothetical protein [Kordia sp. SMS9]AXG69207.1 hypothetical protein KORDIASMS9_01427 [Kordia sp. SMS9]